jgi:NAD(P)-dependent dehydrogenase (short-subunit alcohol dehydrogenase family)
LAEAGAKVVVFADINEETAKASAEESYQYAGNKEYSASFFKVNVTDERGVQEMVNFVVKEFGRIDYCVNGAGVNCPPRGIYSSHGHGR